MQTKNMNSDILIVCIVQIVFTVTQQRLIFKQFVQVLGLCGPQFLSYLPKRFTHLCRALYGDAILVHSFGAPIWPPKINKNIWSTLFL